MELKDFIRETLVQIAHSVVEANETLKDSGARVNPKNVMTYTRGQEVIRRHDTEKEHKAFVDFVEFDVAVYAKEDTTIKGGLGIAVVGIMFGTQGQTANSGGTESRIKFRIPMLLPSAG